MPPRSKACLCGPFFGEVSWEYFRFAPYAIHLKKTNPGKQLIIMTRPERFDLYGHYADILVPLIIKNEEIYKQSAFKLLGFDINMCQKICDVFRLTYKKKYRLDDCYIPDFTSLRYKVKWQFPRSKMDYEFLPRRENMKLVNNLIGKRKIIFTDTGYTYETDKYVVITMEEFNKFILPYIDNKSITYLGCLIHLLRNAKFVVSNLKSDVGKLSILLKTPLIYPYRDISTDNVLLMNPLKTPIVDCESIIEGVRIYENII